MKPICVVLFAGLLIVGCSKGGMPAEKKREFAFYVPAINSAKDFDQAASKMSELKVLTSDEKYDMRYALFDNGKFYYEVANLGTGTGEWKYRNGYINLVAIRTFFNIDIDLTASGGEGEAKEMRFLDRFGKNTVNVKLHGPTDKALLKLDLPIRESL